MSRFIGEIQDLGKALRNCLRYNSLNRYFGYPDARREKTHSFGPVVRKLLNILRERGSRPLRVLEWGPGLNTQIFASVCDYVVSIESNRGWYEKYSQEFSQQTRVKIVYIPFPDDPEGKKSYPGEQPHDRKRYIPHSEYYYPTCDFVLWPLRQYGRDSFDIVFVDGAGYRRDCTRAAREILRYEGIILSHDYPRSDKVQYDMPSGKPYDDVVQEFPYVRLFPEHSTTALSGTSDWFCNRDLQI